MADPDKAIVQISWIRRRMVSFIRILQGIIYYFNDISSTRARVSIYDMHGRMVLTEPVANNSVDISLLAKGAYLVKLEDNGRTMIHKLMKE